MSAAKKAATIINAIGAGTVDDVWPRMEGYSREQVFRALKCAAYAGLIDTDGWTGPRHGGSTPATYRAKKTAPTRPRIASVWQLGAQA